MEKEMKINEETVLAALGRVQDPELLKDLVTLNMIQDLKVEGNRVGFTIMLTTPSCPKKDQIEREAKEAVH